MSAKYIQILIVLMIFTASLQAVGAPKVDIEVNPTAEINVADITIGGIATVKSTDDTLAQQVRTAFICRSPYPGKKVSISRDQIISALRRQNLKSDSYNLKAPQQIAVTRLSRVVTGQELFKTVQDYVLNDTTFQGAITVEAACMPRDQIAPDGTIELRVIPGPQKVRKGRNNVKIALVVDDVIYTDVQVSINVRIIAQVLVATKAIAGTESISAANTTVQELDITNLPSDIVLTAPTADTIAGTSIAEGSVIRACWISVAPAIRSGDVVTVLVSGKSVRLSERGTAASNGRPGDRIRVKLSGDNREVKATVVDTGLVEIDISRRS